MADTRERKQEVEKPGFWKKSLEGVCKENCPFYTVCFQNTEFLVVHHNEEMFVAIWKKYPFIIFFKDRKFHLSHVLPAPATFLIFEKFTRAYFYK